MQVERLQIGHGPFMSGPLLLTPQIFRDDRGFFFESWNQQAFMAALEADGQEPPKRFVQDNHSSSLAGVLRGLHYQRPPRPQGKLVRCVVGQIFDVAVDLRRSSPTFGGWVGACLSGVNHQQLWVPEGFAHGFLTLSKHAEVLYKTTDMWCRDCERSIRWDDPTVGVAWPSGDSASPHLSEKDAVAPFLADVEQGDLF